MSLLSSMNAAVSGLRSHIGALGVVSDNISNVNTLGFKGSRSRFSEVLGDVITGQGSQGGAHGVQMAGASRVFSEGALSGTGIGTDMALRGDGFFVVRDPLNSSGQYYTRVGQFSRQADGSLRAPNGMIAQGYLADSQGRLTSRLGDVSLAGQSSPAKATTNITLSLNLDPTSEPNPLAFFDPTDPNGSSDYTTSVTVHDSLGAAHSVDVYFLQTSQDTWEWHALAEPTEVLGGVEGLPVEVATGTMSFDSDGKITSAATLASSVTFNGAAPDQALNFDFDGDADMGIPPSTSVAGGHLRRGGDADGHAAGELAGFRIGDDGAVIAGFTNGQERLIAQMAVARFANNGGLGGLGDGLFQATEASGDAIINPVGTQGNAEVRVGWLESSNVDLTKEFMDLIAYQRGFQANSKTVQTADDLLAEMINIRR